MFVVNKSIVLSRRRFGYSQRKVETDVGKDSNGRVASIINMPVVICPSLPINALASSSNGTREGRTTVL